MFIAHLPAGYILGAKLEKTERSNALRNKLLLIFTMIGSIAPDFDLLYFYTLNNRQTAHHEYFTHMPIFWLGFALVAAVFYGFKYAKPAIAFLGLSLGGVLHCVLDTPVGGIYWLQPFDDTMTRFAVVPKRYDFWVFNFIFHWYFFIELIIISWAFKVWWSRTMLFENPYKE